MNLKLVPLEIVSQRVRLPESLSATQILPGGRRRNGDRAQEAVKP